MEDLEIFIKGLTKMLISDKIMSADRDTDFLLSTQPQSRFEIPNRISVSNRNVAFLLEVKMKDRICRKCGREIFSSIRECEWCKKRGRAIYYQKHKKKAIIQALKWRKEHPWSRSYDCSRSKCRYSYGRYYNRIKFLMTIQDFKKLWFRDKAYLMKRPSIHRINNNSDYILSNCQFIELSENARLGNLGIPKKWGKKCQRV